MWPVFSHFQAVCWLLENDPANMRWEASLKIERADPPSQSDSAV